MAHLSWARIKPKAHGEIDSGTELSKNDKVQKFAVGSKLHALRPPWPAQGGWPVLGQSQIFPPSLELLLERRRS